MLLSLSFPESGNKQIIQTACDPVQEILLTFKIITKFKPKLRFRAAVPKLHILPNYFSIRIFLNHLHLENSTIHK